MPLVDEVGAGRGGDRRAQHGADPRRRGRSGTTPTSPASGRAFRDGLPDVDLRRVVLLGAGGAGTAVAHALAASACDGCWSPTPTQGAGGRSGSRRWQRSRDRGRARPGDPRRHGRGAARASAGLVNATPVGMAAHPGTPVPVELLRAGSVGRRHRLPPARHRAARAARDARLPDAQRRRHGRAPGGRRVRADHRAPRRPRRDVPRLRRAGRRRGSDRRPRTNRLGTPPEKGSR